MIENSRHVKKRNVDNTWFKKEYQVFLLFSVIITLLHNINKYVLT